MTANTRLLVISFILSALVACAHQTETPLPKVEDRSVQNSHTEQETQTTLTREHSNTNTHHPSADTITALQQRNYSLEQAQKFEKLSLSVQNTTQIENILKSAEFYIQANNTEKTQQLLTQLEAQKTQLNEKQQARLQIIQAYLAFYSQNYTQSLERLQPLLTLAYQPIHSQAGSSQLNTQKVDALLLSTLCYRALNQYVNAIAAFIQREYYLTGKARAQNERFMWSIIQQIDTQTRLQLIQTTDNFLVRNRLQNSLNGQYSNTTTNIAKISQLPLEEKSIPRANLSQIWNPQSTRRIVVLLPLSSRFNKAATAVKDGIEFAHKNTASPYKPQVQFIDVGSEPKNIYHYYSQAVQSGAEVVIGPIGKQYANQLQLHLQRYTNQIQHTPTLLLSGDLPLHTIVAANTPPLFRLSMGNSQQAAILGNEAFRQGYVNAAILAPNTKKGTQLSEAFTQQWLSLGGNVNQIIYYSEQDFDHSNALKQLFNIHQSEQRYAQLSATLGFRPKFSAHRRTDIDFIYLIADNEKGRIIRPQIHFYSKTNIPVLANMEIYNGIEDDKNMDLNQTDFPIMPWTLSFSDISPYAGQLNALFAMGADAYILAAFISQSPSRNTLAINGLMGQLSLTSTGRIHYQPIWAKFIDGKVSTSETYSPLLSYETDSQTTPSSSNDINTEKQYNDQNWEQ